MDHISPPKDADVDGQSGVSDATEISTKKSGPRSERSIQSRDILDSYLGTAT